MLLMFRVSIKNNKKKPTTKTTTELKTKPNREIFFHPVIQYFMFCFVLVCFYLFHFICSMSKIKTIIIIIFYIVQLIKYFPLFFSLSFFLRYSSFTFFLFNLVIFFDCQSIISVRLSVVNTTRFGYSVRRLLHI